MSRLKIRNALETALAGISPALPTAWENTVYAPVIGTAYQRVFLKSIPENLEYGSTYTERGYFQINLYYPQKTGPVNAETRAELVRTTFKRGNSFTSSGLTVTIEGTPEIGGGVIEGDFFKVIIKINFFAYITT